jgi:tetratricopeptide (TPR) repeat protein
MFDPSARINTGLQGRYRIARTLSESGMATVYLAADLRHDRQVALKVLSPDLTEIVGAQRFLNEIKTTANLNHPHIVPLFDSGEVDGLLYYVMPYVEGESLRDLLEREHELAVHDAVRMVVELADALGYAHRHGIVHRDIKPGNILIHDGKALISDFGVALASNTAERDRITGTGHSVGTPHYMSPEQVAPQGDVDGRSDIYALACVLHEMLAGEPVFTGSTPRAVLAKHLAVPPIPIRSVRPRVPAGVERAILRALEKVPADRFQTMDDFAVALEGAVAPASPQVIWRSLRASARAHPVATTAVTATIAGMAVLPITLFETGASWTDHPASVIALPFRAPTSSEGDAALAAEVAAAITGELINWNGVVTASRVDVAGVWDDVALGQSALSRTDDGIAVARAVRAQAMLAVSVTQQSDSATLQVLLIDARSKRMVGEPIVARAATLQLADAEVLAPVVARVVGLADAPSPMRALGAGTREPAAAREYLHGLENLELNRLDQAAIRFARALTLDSTFAAAHSFASQTRFWSNRDYLLPHGPEISRASTAAIRHLSGLSTKNERHVRAFYNLQLGDHERARELYVQILRSDSTDAYALLMLGEIELLDRWLVSSERGLVPRGNLNEARRAFSRAVQTEPTFELAYGRLFAVQRALENALGGRGCPGFEEPDDDVIPIWQRLRPERMRPFCPVATDSVEWLPYAELAVSDETAFRQGADRMFRQAVGALERWASFAPEQPRPLELLSEAHLVQRQQIDLVAPERLQALGAEALGYMTRALALDADTTRMDLVALANLYLAAGQPDPAVMYARRALTAYEQSAAGGPIRAPSQLNNVLVVSGQTAAALTVAAGTTVAQLIPDPDTRDQIALAGAGPILERLRVLGSSGVSGPSLYTELERLEPAWSEAGYSPRQHEVLRNHVTASVMPALVFDPIGLSDWSRGVTREDPTWLALSLIDADPARASEIYESVVTARVLEPRAPHRFVLAAIAGKLGRDADAIRLYSSLDSIPHRVDTFDQGWGLQAVSHLQRARHYENLGDETAAAAHLTIFVDAKSWPDSLSNPRVEQARNQALALTTDN